MKILYVTARWDPRNPDSGSGVNYQAYTFLKNYVEELKITGPFNYPPTIFERGLRKFGELFTQKRLTKFYPSYIRHSNHIVQKMISEFRPDIIFSKSSIPLVNVKLSVPLIYMCDSTVKWVKDNWPHFSKLGFLIMEAWERKVIDKASHIITFSEANKNILKNYYHKPEEQITVHPMPSAIPKIVSNYENNVLKKDSILKLLLVGKAYHLKGVDIAIETTKILNECGIPTELRIVGQDGPSSENVKFMGFYSKNDPYELEQYINNYKWAQFLIFPSRFDAAGIVPSEAAGFGVPTITNAAGGLATTVKNGVSGVVLKIHSPPSAYVKVIQYYLDNPNEYQSLRKSTYDRYLTELNWDALGQTILRVINNTLDS